MKRDAAPTEEWLKQPERGSLWAIRLIAWLTLKLGRGATRWLLYPISAYFLLFSRRARSASAAYLSRVFGRRATWRESFRHYFTFAATIHDRVYLLTGREHYFDIEIDGREILESALTAGRGVVLLGAHVGSFEVVHAAGIARRLPVNLVMYEDNAVRLNSVLQALQPGYAPRVIPLGRLDSLLQAQQRIERGEIVGMLGDRVVASERLVECEFLGSPARFPEGPLLVAALLGAPVVLFAGLYLGARHYRIRFELLGEPGRVERSQRSAVVRGLLARYVEWLEATCREAPYNWFNFYDFWGSDDSRLRTESEGGEQKTED